MNRRYLKIVISTFVTILIMVMIFMLSNQNSGESGSLSERVSRIIASVFISGFESMSFIDQQAIVEAMSWPIRKTAHASEYACLAISLYVTCWQWHALKRAGSPSTHSMAHQVISIALLAFVLTVAYACTDEIHQLFIDGRAGQIADVCVDASGAIIGSIIAALANYLINRKRTIWT